MTPEELAMPIAEFALQLCYEIEKLDAGLQQTKCSAMASELRQRVLKLLERDSDNIEGIAHTWSAIAAAASATQRLRDREKDAQFLAMWVAEDGQSICWSKTSLTPVGAGALAAFAMTLANGLNRQLCEEART